MPARIPRYLPYRILAGLTAAFLALLGTLFIVAFMDRALFPVLARPLFDTNYWGFYILGFGACALFAWAGCLAVAVRAPEHASGIGAATAAGLMLAAIVRLLAWYSGEYRVAGDELRLEAGALSLLALGFVWFRPPAGPGSRSGAP